MLGGLSAGGGTNFGIRAALFRSSTAKGITLSNATKAHPVVLFLFVSVCISLPLSAPRSFRFSPLLLVASPSSPYLTLSLAPSFSFYFSPSLALFPRVVFLSFFFLFLSISPFLSLSLSLLLLVGRRAAHARPSTGRRKIPAASKGLARASKRRDRPGGREARQPGQHDPNQKQEGRRPRNGESEGKADSTPRASRAVPHPSTDRALRRLTSEVERDPVYSTRYGRQRHLKFGSPTLGGGLVVRGRRRRTRG